MGRKVLAALVLIVIALAIVYALGPRVDRDSTVTFDPAYIGGDPAAYLAAQEATIPNIRDGLQKEIIWADPAARAKTPVSVVYIHGFSASKGEVRPLPDNVAKALGANLYYTRLAGHGQDGPAMATATLKAWMNDVAEALAIGRAIGDKVIVMATSTGGSLTAVALARPDLAREVAAAVLVSPNFRVQASGAWLLTGPWGQQIAELIGGKERGFEPPSDLVARLWTTRYPMAATLPMAAAVDAAGKVDAAAIKTPALFVFSEKDQVVDPEATKAMADRWGAPHEIVTVAGAEDPSSHVIAGDAFSPSQTAPLTEKILQWLKGLGVGG